MKMLFDQGVSVPLRDALKGHAVSTADGRGWATLRNGDLLASAESERFDALLTTDKNLEFPHNLAGRAIAILVLPTTAWPIIAMQAKKVN